MKRSKFNEERIASVLPLAEEGTSVEARWTAMTATFPWQRCLN